MDRLDDQRERSGQGQRSRSSGLIKACSLQLLKDLLENVGDINLRVAVIATVRAVNMRQLPCPGCLSILQISSPCAEL